MESLFDEGLADEVLFCCGDSLEEDLRWEPRLGVLVDLVEFEDDVTNDGIALLKTIEAFRGAFFFSTSVELKTKGAGGGGGGGGGGAGREMMDSNTSLPSILTPKHFFGCFYDLFWQIGFCLHLFSGTFFGTQLWLSDLYDHICYQGNNLFGGETKCVVGGWWWSLFYNESIRNLFMDHMLPTCFCFLVQFCALCPKPWHLKHCVILNSSTLKIMPVFWHISPPEISASACFGLSHFIFMKGRSLPVLFYFILSASAWVMLLKSSSSF